MSDLSTQVPVLDTQTEAFNTPSSLPSEQLSFSNEKHTDDVLHLQTSSDSVNPEQKRRRRFWGPPAENKDVPSVNETEKEKPEDERGRSRTKRSRWEDTPDQSAALVVVPPIGDSALVAKFPKEVVLSGGIKVVLPSAITGDGSANPSIYEEYHELNRKLQSGELDIPPEGDPRRSPSPEPVYDKHGIRQNTREIRYRDRLLDKRNRVVEAIMKEDSLFRPPADYRPKRYTKKILIPQDEYPTYNFIGLIIGPRGNTQKKMQRDTNTKIAIRGRGSVKEGASRDGKYDYGEDEELHVLITGETQADVDAAAHEVEKLLQPQDETLNEHKRLQLRELAALNGTLKDEQACPVCGDPSHRSFECPRQQAVDIYQLPSAVKEKVDALYERDVARMAGNNVGRGGQLTDEYQKFLMELGGGPPPEAMGLEKAAAQGARPRRPGHELPDECKLYVGNLPGIFNDAMLRSTFEPFGTVVFSTVVLDGAGNSRNFGFVTFADAHSTRTATAALNGQVFEGKALSVRQRHSENRGEHGASRESWGSTRPGAGPEHGTTGLGSGFGSHHRDDTPDPAKLYIANMPSSMTEQVLRQLLEPYGGGPVELRLITDRVTQQLKGYGFVTMPSAADADAAIQNLNGHKVDGKALAVKPAGVQQPRGGAAGGAGVPPPPPTPGGAPPPPPSFPPLGGGGDLNGHHHLLPPPGFLPGFPPMSAPPQGHYPQGLFAPPHHTPVPPPMPPPGGPPPPSNPYGSVMAPMPPHGHEYSHSMQPPSMQPTGYGMSDLMASYGMQANLQAQGPYGALPPFPGMDSAYQRAGPPPPPYGLAPPAQYGLQGYSYPGMPPMPPHASNDMGQPPLPSGQPGAPPLPPLPSDPPTNGPSEYERFMADLNKASG